MVNISGRVRMLAGSLTATAIAGLLFVVLSSSAPAGNAATVAAKSLTVGRAGVGVTVRFPVRAQLVLMPYVIYNVQHSALLKQLAARGLGAQQPRVSATVEMSIASKGGGSILRVVRRSRAFPLQAWFPRGPDRAKIGFQSIVLSQLRTAALKRLAARSRGRLAVTTRVRWAVRYRNARGRTVELTGTPRSNTQTLVLSGVRGTSGIGSEAVDTRTSVLWVWDSLAGKYAGPINFVTASHAQGDFFHEGPRWMAWTCFTCQWPVGKVTLSVGSASAPAFKVVEGYNEHDTTTPRMTCEIQGATGLSTTCATFQSSWPGCQTAPIDGSVSNYTGMCLSPVAIDTWIVSAPGICSVAGVGCSGPQNNQAVGSFSGNEEVYAMRGIFAYDPEAHQFAGPIARTGHSESSDTKIDLNTAQWGIDKWHAGTCSTKWCKNPSGWVQFSFGSTTATTTRAPLLVKTIYNESDSSKPRISCTLDFVGLTAAPTCLAYPEQINLDECPGQTPSGACWWPTHSFDSWFVMAPGLCKVAGVTCSAIPPDYSQVNTFQQTKTAIAATEYDFFNGVETIPLTLTVTNQDPGVKNTPTGTLTVTAGVGSFSPTPCTLTPLSGSGGNAAFCITTLSPPASARGTFDPVTVNYSGDANHAPSTLTQNVPIF